MGKWIDTLFCSDEHISDQTSGDDFFPRKEKFFDLLSWARAEKIKKIATLGDFQDNWEADSDKIRKKYNDIFEYILGNFRWNYITGNHDELSWALGAFKCELENPYKYKISFHKQLIIDPTGEVDIPVNKILPAICEHGDRFDSVISKNKILAGTIAKVGGFAERHGFPNIDKWFSKIESWVSGIGKHDLGGSMDKEFSNWSVSNGFKMTIAGHTHKNKVEFLLERDGKTKHLYLNCGSWTNADRPCSAVVIREEIIQIVESTDKGIKISKTIDLGE